MEKIQNLSGKLCLRPRSKELRSIFFRFRCEDVAVMSSYFIMTSGATLCFNIFFLFNSPSI